MPTEFYTVQQRDFAGRAVYLDPAGNWTRNMFDAATFATDAQAIQAFSDASPAGERATLTDHNRNQTAFAQ